MTARSRARHRWDQHDIGAIHGDIGPCSDRKSHIGLRERRCVGDAVANHADLRGGAVVAERNERVELR